MPHPPWRADERGVAMMDISLRALDRWWAVLGNCVGGLYSLELQRVREQDLPAYNRRGYGWIWMSSHPEDAVPLSGAHWMEWRLSAPVVTRVRVLSNNRQQKNSRKKEKMGDAVESQRVYRREGLKERTQQRKKGRNREVEHTHI
jgi:hypothetical protein